MGIFNRKEKNMKKIILDCDPGMDDSMAIVMAVKSEALDVLSMEITRWM